MYPYDDETDESQVDVPVADAQQDPIDQQLDANAADLAAPDQQAPDTVDDVSPEFEQQLQQYFGNPRTDAVGHGIDPAHLLAAVSGQESGGNYRAVNKDSGALGKYQILPSHLTERDWALKHLGRAYTPQEFLNDPKAQEALAGAKLSEYVNKAIAGGADEDTAIRMAAAAWYGGEGAMKAYNSTKPQAGYPSIADYTESVRDRYQKRVAQLAAQQAPVAAETTDIDSWLEQNYGSGAAAPAASPWQGSAAPPAAPTQQPMTTRQRRRQRQQSTKASAGVLSTIGSAWDMFSQVTGIGGGGESPVQSPQASVEEQQVQQRTFRDQAKHWRELASTFRGQGNEALANQFEEVADTFDASTRTTQPQTTEWRRTLHTVAALEDRLAKATTPESRAAIQQMLDEANSHLADQQDKLQRATAEAGQSRRGGYVKDTADADALVKQSESGKGLVGSLKNIVRAAPDLPSTLEDWLKLTPGYAEGEQVRQQKLTYGQALQHSIINQTVPNILKAVTGVTSAKAAIEGASNIAAVGGIANREFMEAYREKFGGPTSKPRNWIERMGSDLLTMGLSEAAAQAGEGAKSLAQVYDEAIGRKSGPAALGSDFLHSLEHLGAVANNPLESASAFIAGLTGVENVDPDGEAYMRMSRKQRERFDADREYASFIPRNVGMLLPFSITRVFGPLAPVVEASIGAAQARAGALATRNPFLSDDDYKGAVDTATANGALAIGSFMLGGRLFGNIGKYLGKSRAPVLAAFSDLIASAAGGVVGAEGHGAFNDVLDGKNPVNRAKADLAAVYNAMFGTVREGMSPEEIQLAKSRRITAHEDQQTHGLIEAALIPIFAHPDVSRFTGRRGVFVDESTGRAAILGPTGRAEVVPVDTLSPEQRQGAVSWGLLEQAGITSGFDRMFGPEGAQRPGFLSKSPIYELNNSGKLAGTFSEDHIPDQQRVVTDPDEYKAELLEQGGEAQTYAKALLTLQDLSAKPDPTPDDTKRMAMAQDIVDKVKAKGTEPGMLGSMDADAAMKVARDNVAKYKYTDIALQSPETATEYAQNVGSRMGKFNDLTKASLDNIAKQEAVVADHAQRVRGAKAAVEQATNAVHEATAGVDAATQAHIDAQAAAEQADAVVQKAQLAATQSMEAHRRAILQTPMSKKTAGVTERAVQQFKTAMDRAGKAVLQAQIRAQSAMADAVQAEAAVKTAEQAKKAAEAALQHAEGKHKEAIDLHSHEENQLATVRETESKNLETYEANRQEVLKQANAAKDYADRLYKARDAVKERIFTTDEGRTAFIKEIADSLEQRLTEMGVKPQEGTDLRGLAEDNAAVLTALLERSSGHFDSLNQQSPIEDRLRAAMHMLFGSDQLHDVLAPYHVLRDLELHRAFNAEGADAREAKLKNVEALESGDFGAGAYDHTSKRIYLPTLGIDPRTGAPMPGGAELAVNTILHEFMHAIDMSDLLTDTAQRSFDAWAKNYVQQQQLSGGARLSPHGDVSFDALTREAKVEAFESVITGRGVPDNMSPEVQTLMDKLAGLFKGFYTDVYTHIGEQAITRHDLLPTADEIHPGVRDFFASVIGDAAMNTGAFAENPETGDVTFTQPAGTVHMSGAGGATIAVRFPKNDKLTRLLYDTGSQKLLGTDENVGQRRAKIKAIAGILGISNQHAERLSAAAYTDFKHQAMRHDPANGELLLRNRLPMPERGDSPELVALKDESRRLFNAVQGYTDADGARARVQAVKEYEKRVATALSNMRGRAVTDQEVDTYLKGTAPAQYWHDRAGRAADPLEEAKYRAYADEAQKTEDAKFGQVVSSPNADEVGGRAAEPKPPAQDWANTDADGIAAAPLRAPWGRARRFDANGKEINPTHDLEKQREQEELIRQTTEPYRPGNEGTHNGFILSNGDARRINGPDSEAPEEHFRDLDGTGPIKLIRPRTRAEYGPMLTFSAVGDGYVQARIYGGATPAQLRGLRYIADGRHLTVRIMPGGFDEGEFFNFKSFGKDDVRTLDAAIAVKGRAEAARDEAKLERKGVRAAEQLAAEQRAGIADRNAPFTKQRAPKKGTASHRDPRASLTPEEKLAGLQDPLGHIRAYYGTTDDPEAAGFIHPDGDLIHTFRGRSSEGQFIHDEVLPYSGIDTQDLRRYGLNPGFSGGLNYLLYNGGVRLRFRGTDLTVQWSQPLTDAQLRTIQSLADSKAKSVSLYVSDPEGMRTGRYRYGVDGKISGDDLTEKALGRLIREMSRKAKDKYDAEADIETPARFTSSEAEAAAEGVSSIGGESEPNSRDSARFGVDTPPSQRDSVERQLDRIIVGDSPSLLAAPGRRQQPAPDTEEWAKAHADPVGHLRDYFGTTDNTEEAGFLDRGGAMIATFTDKGGGRDFSFIHQDAIETSGLKDVHYQDLVASGKAVRMRDYGGHLSFEFGGGGPSEKQIDTMIGESYGRPSMTVEYVVHDADWGSNRSVAHARLENTNDGVAMEKAIKQVVDDGKAWQARESTLVAAPGRKAPDTEEFKKFFGDSKAVDEDGNPRVMYHGSGEPFTTFKTDNGPVWFAEDPALSDEYAFGNAEYDMAYRDQRGAQSYPVYIKAENPLVIDGESTRPILAKQLTNIAKIPFAPEDPETYHSIWAHVATPEFAKAVKAAGYDSIRMQERGKQTWGVLDPTQIKSAIGNRGTYDPEDASILNAPRRTTIDSLPKFTPEQEREIRFPSGIFGTDYSKTVKQDVTSEKTSRPQQRPGLYSAVKDEHLAGVKSVFEIGAGKTPYGAEILKGRGVRTVLSTDPFNRPADENRKAAMAAERNPVDAAFMANVLNVIPDRDARIAAMRSARRYVKDGGSLFIGVYTDPKAQREGLDSDFTGDGYQMRKNLSWYLPEVKEAYPNSVIEQHGGDTKGYLKVTVDRPMFVEGDYGKVPAFGKEGGYTVRRGRLITPNGESLKLRPDGAIDMGPLRAVKGGQRDIEGITEGEVKGARFTTLGTEQRALMMEAAHRLAGLELDAVHKDDKLGAIAQYFQTLSERAFKGKTNPLPTGIRADKISDSEEFQSYRKEALRRADKRAVVELRDFVLKHKAAAVVKGSFDWYKASIDDALRSLHGTGVEEFAGLKVNDDGTYADPQEVRLFRTILAMHSAGSAPDVNAKAAILQYADWRRVRLDAGKDTMPLPILDMAKWEIEVDRKKPGSKGETRIMRREGTLKSVDESQNPLLARAGFAYSRLGHENTLYMNQLMDPALHPELGGDIHKVVDWLLTPHDEAEVKAVFNQRPKRGKLKEDDPDAARAAEGGQWAPDTFRGLIDPDTGEYHYDDSIVHDGKVLGAYTFGPKIGAFVSNLNGLSGELTPDLWWSRTWNRWQGSMMWPLKTGKRAWNKSKKGIKESDYPDYAWTGVAEIPRNNHERNVMREAAQSIATRFSELVDPNHKAYDKRVVDALGIDPGHKFAVSEVQSMLWYMEQQYYAQQGHERAKSRSYDQQAKDMAADWGNISKARENAKSVFKGIVPHIDKSIYEQQLHAFTVEKNAPARAASAAATIAIANARDAAELSSVDPQWRPFVADYHAWRDNLRDVVPQRAVMPGARPGRKAKAAAEGPLQAPAPKGQSHTKALLEKFGTESWDGDFRKIGLIAPGGEPIALFKTSKGNFNAGTHEGDIFVATNGNATLTDVQREGTLRVRFANNAQGGKNLYVEGMHIPTKEQVDSVIEMGRRADRILFDANNLKGDPIGYGETGDTSVAGIEVALRDLSRLIEEHGQGRVIPRAEWEALQPSTPMGPMRHQPDDPLKAPRAPWKREASDELAQILQRGGHLSPQDLADMIGTVPYHLASVADYYTRQRGILFNGKVTERAVAQSLLFTLSSINASEHAVETNRAGIQREGLSPELLPEGVSKHMAALGLTPRDFLAKDATGADVIRPEDLFGKFLASDEGQDMIDQIVAGNVDLSKAERVRNLWGGAATTVGNAGKEPGAGYSLRNLKQLTADLNAAGLTRDPQAVMDVLSRVKGIGPAKTPFLATTLGLGWKPTLDAVEQNLHLRGTDRATSGDALLQYTKQLKGTDPDFQKLADFIDLRLQDVARIPQIRKQMTETQLDPLNLGATMHHMVWDAIKGTTTTHAGPYAVIENANQSDPVRAPRRGVGQVISDAMSPEDTAAISRKRTKASLYKRALNAVANYTRGNLLSNAATSATNVTTNIGRTLQREGATVPSNVLDMLSSTLSGLRSQQVDVKGAVGAALRSFSTKGLNNDKLQAFQKGGIALAWDRLLNVDPHNPQERGEGSEAGDAKGLSVKGKIKRMFVDPENADLPALARIPINLAQGWANIAYGVMGAEDAFAFTYHLQRSLRQLAKTQAMNERKFGGEADWRARAKEILEDPDQHIIDMAQSEAMIYTFQNSTRPHEIIAAIKAQTNRWDGPIGPLTHTALEMLVPFSKTPSAIIVQGLDLLGGDFVRVLGGDLPKFIGALKAGKHKAIDTMPEVMAIQRQMTNRGGNALVGGAMWTGIILGAAGVFGKWYPHVQPLVGEDDKDKSKNVMLDKAGLGYRGGRIVIDPRPLGIDMEPFTADLTNGGPLGSFLLTAFAAGNDLRENGYSLKGQSGAALVQAGRAMAEYPLVKAVVDMNEVANSEYAAKRFEAGMAQRFIPASAALSGVARNADPYERDAKTVGDMVKAGIPWKRQQLPPKEDQLTGQPQERKAVAPAYLPFGIQHYRGEDPTLKAVAHLGLRFPKPEQRKGEDPATYEARTKRYKEAWRGYLKDTLAKYGDSIYDAKDEGSIKNLHDQIQQEVTKQINKDLKDEFPNPNPKKSGGGSSTTNGYTPWRPRKF